MKRTCQGKIGGPSIDFLLVKFYGSEIRWIDIDVALFKLLYSVYIIILD